MRTYSFTQEEAIALLNDTMGRTLNIRAIWLARAKYYSKYDVVDRAVAGSHVAASTTAPYTPSAMSFALLYAANRIWREDLSSLIPIKFINHMASRAETTPVDLGEFLWVKCRQKRFVDFAFGCS